MSVHAFDTADGTQIWRRDLSVIDWAASWSGVTVDADNVVVGAVNDDLHLAALDAATGEVRWRHLGRDIAGVSTTPAIAGDAVLVLRAPGWLESYALTDGTQRWKVPLDDAWPVALAVDDTRAVVRSATGTVTAHTLADGETCWTCALGAGRRAARPYSRSCGGARVPLVITADAVWTASFDALVGIDLASGEIINRTEAGGEVATVVADGDEALAVTVDARVVRSTG
jgi:outer membrane protein assembly factor BamB